MAPFGRHEKELGLDYDFGLTRTGPDIPVSTPCARSEQAGGLRAPIHAALALLESLRPEPCPAELAERTVQLLCATARAEGKPAASSLRTLED